MRSMSTALPKHAHAMIYEESIMDKIKNRIKQPVNINLIFALVMAVFMTIFAVVNHFRNIAQNRIYGNAVCHACNMRHIHIWIKMPLYFASAVLILSIVSRIIYSPKSSKRIMFYKVVSGVLYLYIVFSCFIYFGYMVDAVTLIPTVILYFLTAVMVMIGIRNTYSKRI